MDAALRPNEVRVASVAKPHDGRGVLRERFGPFSFVLRPKAKNGRVAWPVERWRALGVAMPRMRMPKSETFEVIGEGDKFRSDVSISLPFIGLVIRYRGWLEPVSPSAQGVSSVGAPAVAPMARQS